MLIIETNLQGVDFRDRYKDVLAASDAIKTMKTTSQVIVDNIEKITDTCEKLVKNPIQISTKGNLTVNKYVGVFLHLLFYQ